MIVVDEKNGEDRAPLINLIEKVPDEKAPQFGVLPGNPEQIDLGWQWQAERDVIAGQGGHDARHVDTVGDGNTGSSADAASNRDDHRPAAQSDPPESPTEGPWK